MKGENQQQALILLNNAISESNGSYNDIVMCMELATANLLETALNVNRSKAIIKRNQLAITELNNLISVNNKDFKKLCKCITSISVPNTTEILDEYLIGGEVESVGYADISLDGYENEFEVGEDIYVVNFNYHESDLEVNEINFVSRNGVDLELMNEQEKELTKIVFNKIELI
jgi:hypothetical protein